MQNLQQIVHPNYDHIVVHPNSNHIVAYIANHFNSPFLLIPHSIIVQYFTLPHTISIVHARYYLLYSIINSNQYYLQPHHDYHQSTITTQLHYNLSITGNHGRQPQKHHSNVKTIKNHVNIHKASLKLVAEKQKSGLVFKLSFAFDANLPGK